VAAAVTIPVLAWWWWEGRWPWQHDLLF
jgi:hypothetical protein